MRADCIDCIAGKYSTVLSSASLADDAYSSELGNDLERGEIAAAGAVVAVPSASDPPASDPPAARIHLGEYTVSIDKVDSARKGKGSKGKAAASGEEASHT